MKCKIGSERIKLIDKTAGIWEKKETSMAIEINGGWKKLNSRSYKLCNCTIETILRSYSLP